MSDELKYKLIVTSAVLGLLALGGLFLWRSTATPPPVPKAVQTLIKTTKEEIQKHEEALKDLRKQNDASMPKPTDFSTDALVEWFNDWLFSRSKDSARQDNTGKERPE